jgi:proton glutamate symport protein
MNKAVIILLALLLGITAGMLCGDSLPWLIEAADVVGSLWLNAMRMTVVPLVVSLLIVGILQAANMARAGGMTVRAICIMMVILWLSAAMSALLTPALLAMLPLPADAAMALKSALGSSNPPGDVPPFTDMLRALIPTNPINAAANDQILPLIIFTLAFAFAVSKLPSKRRETMRDFFDALSEAMIILITWVLTLAPIGVFALAMVVGQKAGVASFVGLAHYVTIVVAIGTVVWIASFAVAAIFAKQSPLAFFRAAAPAQAIAISTQSSIASLPAMVAGLKSIGIGSRSTDVVMPIAVALFRATGPCMNLAVAIYVAHLLGYDLTPGQLLMGVIAAAITTLGAVSLPGSISFISSIAPINLAMGVPLEPLMLFLAIETFPDIMRTLGNVTMDMAVTATVAQIENDADEGVAL